MAFIFPILEYKICQKPQKLSTGFLWFFMSLCLVGIIAFFFVDDIHPLHLAVIFPLYNFLLSGLGDLKALKSIATKNVLTIDNEKITYNKFSPLEKFFYTLHIIDCFKIPVSEIDTCKLIKETVVHDDGLGTSSRDIFFIRVTSPFWRIIIQDGLIPVKRENFEVPDLLDVLKQFAKRKLEIVNDDIDISSAKYLYNRCFFEFSLLWFKLTVLLPLLIIIVVFIYQVLNDIHITYIAVSLVLFCVYGLLALRGALFFKNVSKVSLIIENKKLYFSGGKKNKLMHYLFPTLRLPKIKYDLDDLVYVGHEAQKLKPLAWFDGPMEAITMKFKNTEEIQFYNIFEDDKEMFTNLVAIARRNYLRDNIGTN